MVEGTDPFSEFTPETGEVLHSFASHLAWWMGNVNKTSVRKLRTIWSKNPELKKWLKKHVNGNVGPLYYGAWLKPGAEMPEVGSPFKRPGKGVQHWSKNLSQSRKFAGIGMSGDKAGYVLVAYPKPSQIIVDVDAFSALAGRHKASFKALMVRSDPVEMFSGEQYEAEVLTTPLPAKVLEVSK